MAVAATGPATAGSMLRDPHAVLRTYPVHLPVLAPLGDIPAYLIRPQTLLTPADVRVLTEAYARLTEDLGPAAATGQVLHGDAGIGNLMAAGGRWVATRPGQRCRGPLRRRRPSPSPAWTRRST